MLLTRGIRFFSYGSSTSVLLDLQGSFSFSSVSVCAANIRKSDRRILCDKTSPVCKNCRKGRRECLQDQIRLSWPRPNDPRRTIIGSKQNHDGLTWPRKFIFVNTYTWHIELHNLLANCENSSSKSRRTLMTLASIFGSSYQETN